MNGNAVHLLLDAGVIVFIMSTVFYAGRLTARVDALEQWRAEVLRVLERIDDSLRRMERLLTDQEA